jgi:hypothetical protein
MRCRNELDALLFDPELERAPHVFTRRRGLRSRRRQRPALGCQNVVRRQDLPDLVVDDLGFMHLAGDVT